MADAVLGGIAASLERVPELEEIQCMKPYDNLFRIYL